MHLSPHPIRLRLADVRLERDFWRQQSWVWYIYDSIFCLFSIALQVRDTLAHGGRHAVGSGPMLHAVDVLCIACTLRNEHLLGDRVITL